MEDLKARRRVPFAIATTLLFVICVAVVLVPETYLLQLQRNRPLNDDQAGWAYRLLVFFALVQMIYAGFSVFRIERVAEARERDGDLAGMPKAKAIASLARNAAALVVFTVIYGVASVAITGQRGGFWLFPVLAVAQAAWYYREVGQIAEWETFQEEATDEDADRVWKREPPDYCPPLTRGLIEGANPPPS